MNDVGDDGGGDGDSADDASCNAHDKDNNGVPQVDWPVLLSHSMELDVVAR